MAFFWFSDDTVFETNKSNADINAFSITIVFLKLRSNGSLI